MAEAAAVGAAGRVATAAAEKGAAGRAERAGPRAAAAREPVAMAGPQEAEPEEVREVAKVAVARAEVAMAVA